MNTNKLEIPKVTYSEESKKEVIEICENYYNLCVKCAKNPDMLEAFKKNPVPFLTDGSEKFNWKGCGMSLPVKTKVVLDHSVAWPTLTLVKIDSDELPITIKEGPWSVIINNGNTDRTSLEFNDYPEIQGMINGKIDDYSIILTMPDFTPVSDELLKYSFEDAKDAIILTTC